MSLVRSETREKDVPAETFPKQSNLCYYYVAIPVAEQTESNDSSTVVSTTAELKDLLKRNPKARFYSASTPEEAKKKAEALEASPIIPNVSSSSKAAERKGRSSDTSSVGLPVYSAPPPAELSKMGKEISNRENEMVFARMAINPRYLCRDTELPTILQQGCKLNALHLAAKVDNHNVLKRVLDLVSCLDFLKQIYPKQSEDRLRASAKHLIRNYLNSPDKMLNHTPLHFACEFNSVNCVEILLAHPYCDTRKVNLEGKTAFEVIGARADENTCEADRIRQLFEQRFIVPIWRDMSVEGEAPVLGDVSFIRDLGQEIPHPLLTEILPHFSLSLLKPCKATLIPTHVKYSKLGAKNLQSFENQPRDWKIRAFAGPMNEKQAREFRRILKDTKGLIFGINSPDVSPNRSPASASNSSPLSPLKRSFPSAKSSAVVDMMKSPPLSPTSSLNWSMRNPSGRSLFSPFSSKLDLRVKDAEKGLERIASEFCNDLEVPWSEYWDFLGTFCDLTSEKGIDMVESYLHSLDVQAEVSLLMENNKSLDLDYLVEKLSGLKLNSSGSLSPQTDKYGLCVNKACRMLSRFCNCAGVVPQLPIVPSSPQYDTHWIKSSAKENAQNTETLKQATQSLALFLSKRRSSFGLRKYKSPESLNNSRESQNDSLDSFRTAPTTPSLDLSNEIFQDCRNSIIFLSGSEQPRKSDHQVYMVLKDHSEKIDLKKHFRTYQWLTSMRTRAGSLGQKALNASLNGYTPRRLFRDMSPILPH